MVSPAEILRELIVDLHKGKRDCISKIGRQITNTHTHTHTHTQTRTHTQIHAEHVYSCKIYKFKLKFRENLIRIKFVLV